MSVSSLDKIKSSVDKIARKEFYDAIGVALKGNTKTTKGTSAVFRSQVLNKSLHVLSLAATIQFLREYDPQATEQDGIFLFEEYKRVASKYYSDSKGIYTIEHSKINTPYIRDNLIKFINREPITTNALSILNSLFTANGFSTIDSIKSKIVPSTKYPTIINNFLSANTDIGHKSGSNIEYLSNIATVSGFLDTSPAELAELYTNATKKDIKDKVLQFYKDELLASKSELNSAIQDKIFEYIYESQLSLIREFSQKKGFKGLVSLELTKQGALQKISQRVIENITKTALVEVGIQNREINQEVGRTIEAFYRRHLPIVYGGLLKVFKEQLDVVDAPTLRGSKNMVEIMEDIVLNSITKPSNNINIRSSVKGSIAPLRKAGTKPKVTKSTTKAKLTKNRLRSTSGAFQSVASLEALIRAGLYDTIKKNMVSPGLNFKTGRLAKSVDLKSVSYDSRQGELTAFLSYMKYPYSTFEPGNARGSIDRSPTSLITRSVRELAVKLTKSRMKVIMV